MSSTGNYLVRSPVCSHILLDMLVQIPFFFFFGILINSAGSLLTFSPQGSTSLLILFGLVEEQMPRQVSNHNFFILFEPFQIQFAYFPHPLTTMISVPVVLDNKCLQIHFHANDVELFSTTLKAKKVKC